MVLQRRVGRQLQADLHHVIGQTRQAHHARRHLAHRERTGSSHLARLQHQVGLRLGAAGQHHAGGQLLVRHGLGLVGAMCDFATDLLAFAGSAGTILAAVGQADGQTDAGIEHGFAVQNLELAAAGLDMDLVSHGG